MQKILKYLREVKLELAKVSWPSRHDATRMTGIVIASSLAVGLYIGGLDFILTSLLGLLLK